MRHDQPLPTARTRVSSHRSIQDTAVPRRGYVARLFAAALDGDPIANEEIADLAPWDLTAAVAFEALAVAEFVRDHVSAD